MKKRVGIARSMMLKPKVILYDEPTVSLGPLQYSQSGQDNAKIKEKRDNFYISDS